MGVAYFVREPQTHKSGQKGAAGATKKPHTGTPQAPRGHHLDQESMEDVRFRVEGLGLGF